MISETCIALASIRCNFFYRFVCFLQIQRHNSPRPIFCRATGLSPFTNDCYVVSPSELVCNTINRRRGRCQKSQPVLAKKRSCYSDDKRATDSIAVAAQIDPSYSPCGASVQPHLIHGLRPTASAPLPPKRHLNRLGRFCGAHGRVVTNRTHRQTDTQTAPLSR